MTQSQVDLQTLLDLIKIHQSLTACLSAMQRPASPERADLLTAQLATAQSVIASLISKIHG